MPLSDLAGQRRAYEILGGALTQDQVHHAYLFAGPEGSGTEQGALLLAQALNCEAEPNRGCGICATCRTIAARNHPDVSWVMPEAELVARKLAIRSDFAETPSRDVKIAQVRHLVGRMSVKALTARWKVAIILAAERMNIPAQNALLKTLEEPPPATTLILVTSVADSLLPTIRSRCLRVPFAPASIDQVALQVARERKLPEDRARLCARLSFGSLTRALQFDEDRLQRRVDLFEGLTRLQPDDTRPALDLAEEFAKDRTEAEWTLSMLELWLRDQLVVLEGAPQHAANTDLGELLDRSSKGQQPGRILERIEAVQLASENLLRNAGPRFQLERIFLTFVP